MTKIRTVVVDDEPMARERIIGMLNQEKDIEVVGEYADGTSAVSAIQSQHPDLVFLDVQMPSCDGFGVIQQLGAERQPPAVVFVTAYDEYALKAFEVHAIDYLLKPFGRDRFAQTLQHAREHLERRRAGDLGKRLMALVQDIKPEPQKLDRLVIKSGGRVFFLRTQEIDWIEEVAGNYVKLHLGDESHLFRETMNNMEGRLDLQRFVRIHRSRIVNTDRIKEMQPWFNGEYVVVLQNGTRLTLSRGYREKLQERLGKGFLMADEHHGEKELAAFIRAGAERRPDQAYGDYYRGKNASCALGAAYEGMYRLPTDATGQRPTKDLEWFFDCLEGSVRRCPGGDSCRKTLSLAAILVHLNDEHRWSREQIAAWLDTLM